MPEDKKVMVTTRIEKSVLKELQLIKLEHDLKSVSDAVKYLLDQKK